VELLCRVTPASDIDWHVTRTTPASSARRDFEQWDECNIFNASVENRGAPPREPEQIGKKF
jgi:hypothetical protein